MTKIREAAEHGLHVKKDPTFNSTLNCTRYISCWDIVPELKYKISIVQNLDTSGLHPRYRPPRGAILISTEVSQFESPDISFSKSCAEILEDLRMPTLSRHDELYAYGFPSSYDLVKSKDVFQEPTTLMVSSPLNAETSNDSVDSVSENDTKLKYGSAEVTVHELLKLSSGLHNKWTGMMDGYERVREWQQQMGSVTESSPKLLPISEIDYSNLDVNDFLEQLNIKTISSVNSESLIGREDSDSLIDIIFTASPRETHFLALDSEIEYAEESIDVGVMDEEEDAY